MKKILFALACIMSMASASAQYIESGYHGFATIGDAIMVDETRIGSVDLTTTHGYQFNSKFFLGGGVGYTYVYNNHHDNFSLIPVFADIHYTILDKRITPFIDVKGGYALNASYSDDNMGFVSPSVGVRFAIGDTKLGINASLGYTGYFDHSTENFIHLKVGIDW